MTEKHGIAIAARAEIPTRRHPMKNRRPARRKLTPTRNCHENHTLSDVAAARCRLGRTQPDTPRPSRTFARPRA
uniref:Uncharacterized protein n=1 Tax=Conchiformibius kuhniae TaxID=211502 RepID=A0A8T9MYL7_9NEIS|nr:hypothetical protein LVJ77_03470 [Conchiformibius kuhniae]